MSIGELVESTSTWNPLDEPSGAFDYIDLSAVDQFAKRIAEPRRLQGKDAPSRARQIVSKGDVLVSTVRPNLNGVAVVPPELDGATASTGFCVLRTRSAFLDHSYLFHWVKSPQFIADMTRKATGASYPAVSDRIIFESSLPLPSLREQRRIAEVLDGAEALRAKRRAALAQLDTLAQSIFLDLIGDPATNPRKWHMKRLEEICREVTDIDHKMPKSVEEGIPFISAKDLLDDGTLSFEDVKKISREDFNRLARKSKPARGDIVYSRIGVNLGKARLVEVDFDFLASYSCCTIKPLTESVDPLFLCSFLDSPFALKQARKGIRAIAVPDLGMNEIKNFQVPVPPMAVQKEFRGRLEAAARVRNAYRISLPMLDALFVSLQYRAFRGELLSNVPPKHSAAMAGAEGVDL